MTRTELLAVAQSYRLELAVVTVQRHYLAAVSHGDAEALELQHEVVRHRLAEIGAAVKQRHECAAARKPDGGLAAELPPPTTPTRCAAQRCASGGPAA